MTRFEKMMKQAEAAKLIAVAREQRRKACVQKNNYSGRQPGIKKSLVDIWRIANANYQDVYAAQTAIINALAATEVES